MRVDDRVLIQDSNQVRGNCKLGKLSKAYPGDDARVRKVDVKYKNPRPGEPVNKYQGSSDFTVQRVVQRLVRCLLQWQTPRKSQLNSNKECQNVRVIRVQFRDQVYHGDDINFSKGFFSLGWGEGGEGGACFADACEISCVYTHYIPYARA